MKSWAWGAMVMTVFALGACKKSTSSTTNSTSTSSSSSGTGGDTGTGGSSSGSNSGGAGGAGGAGSTGTNTTSTGTNTTSTGTNTTTTGSNTTTTTTTGGGGACDGTGVCQDMDMDPTNDCVSCAFQDACSAQVQACTAEPDCCDAQPCSANSFVGCIGKCAQGDAACQMACAQSHPTGASIYNDLAVCVICDNCPMDCDGPGSGCP